MTTLIETLIIDEGLRLTPYRCSEGKLTIGIGHNLDDNGITKEQAIAICMDDIANVQRELANHPELGPTYAKLDEARKLAVDNMAFNLGIPTLRKFEKMWNALAIEDWETAADEAKDSRWYRQVKARGDRIVSVIRTGTLETYQ